MKLYLTMKRNLLVIHIATWINVNTLLNEKEYNMYIHTHTLTQLALSKHYAKQSMKVAASGRGKFPRRT